MNKGMKKTVSRSEVPDGETWDLRDLFDTEEAWKHEVESIERDMETVTQYKGHLAENAKNLLDCLLSREALSERLIRVMTYASLRQSTDGTNPVHQALVASLVSAVRANLSFIDSEILALTDQMLQDYIEQEDG